MGLGSPYKEMKGPLSYSKSYLSIFPLKLLWFFSFPSLFYHVGSSFSHPFWINCYNLASVYSAHLTTNLQQKQHPNHVYHSTTCYGSQVLTGLNPLFILVFSLQCDLGPTLPLSQLTLHRSLLQPSQLPISCLPNWAHFHLQVVPHKVPWPGMSSLLFSFPSGCQ